MAGCYVSLSHKIRTLPFHTVNSSTHYNDIIMSTMAFQITGVSIVYSTICSGTDQRKYQSSASLAFVRGIHRWPVNSPSQYKDNLSRYGYSHYNDEKVVRPSFLYNGNPYIGKAPWYWDSPRILAWFALYHLCPVWLWFYLLLLFIISLFLVGLSSPGNKSLCQPYLYVEHIHEFRQVGDILMG